MARPRKIVRTKRIYKKKTSKNKVASTFFFILLLCLLVGFGFIASKEWSKRFGPNAPKPDLSSNLTSSNNDSSENTSSNPSSEGETPTNISGVKAAYLSAQMLKAQSADQYLAYLTGLKADGYNAVVVQLKTEDGKIQFNTTNADAKKFGAIIEAPIDLNTLVKAIKDAGLKPIAQMSALKDATAPHVKNENSYAYSTFLDTNWLDNSVALGGKPWLNPYMEKARSYLSALTGEVANSGFEIIVLDHVMFPEKNTGKLNPINENKPRAEILKQVLVEAQAAAGDAVVLQGADIEAYANVNAVGYQNNISAIGYQGASPFINMDIITASISQIKAAGQVTGTNQEIVKALLQKIVAQSGETSIVPVIRSADLAVLQPILKELKIDQYIVIE